MENKIKETTEQLKNGTITKDEADKILLDLFGVIKPLKDSIEKPKIKKISNIFAIFTPPEHY